MKFSAFDIGEKIKIHELTFNLCPELWNNYCYDELHIDSLDFKEIKFLNENGDALNDKIKLISNASGGLYFFIIKTDISANLPGYLVYIGRAQLTANHNLRVRIKSYFSTYLKEKERPKITRMIKYWGNNLYVKYVEVSGNKHIEEIEKKLINSLLPPLNDMIPDKIYKDAIKAF